MYTINRLLEISSALRARKDNGLNFHTTFAFYKKRLLAIGNNSCKTHPKNLTLPHFDDLDGVSFQGTAFTHAELSCVIRMGEEDCRDITFVNVRLGHNNEPRMARPCTACQALFNQVGYKRVCYTTATGLNQWNPHGQDIQLIPLV